MECSHRIFQHVEILGFTDEQMSLYICNIVPSSIKCVSWHIVVLLVILLAVLVPVEGMIQDTCLEFITILALMIRIHVVFYPLP